MSRQNIPSGTLKKQVTYDLQIKEKALNGLSNQTLKTTIDDGKEDRTILRGHFSCDYFQNAIQLHSSDTVEVQDHTVEGLLEPALTACILLEGQIKSQIGETEFTLDASDGPVGYIWGYGKPTYWYRHIRAGMKVRKINITVEADWLRKQIADGGIETAGITDLLDKDFEIHELAPSARAVALTNQIIMQHHHNPLVLHLRRESRALEILGEALEKLPNPSPNEIFQPPEKDGHQVSRAEQIRDYIEKHDMATLSLSVLSNQLGYSIGSMQSWFKHTYDMTIMDYIRERRLIIARDAMEQDGLPIAKAAYLAGYNSPSNFSTAFKRQFGISPSEIHFN